MPDAQRSTDLEGIDASDPAFRTAVARLSGWLPIEASWRVTNGDGTDGRVPTDDRIRGSHVDVVHWPQPGLFMKTSEE